MKVNNGIRSMLVFSLMVIIGNSLLFSQSAYTNNQLEVLCKTLGTDKTIVGLGESTHGTKEFTLIRAEMVKVLITKYDYRIFILEAEYAPCENINAYLHSGIGNADSLLRTVRLWPWINEDFLSLLVWIKDYNLEHPEKKVRFYGMDSQYSKLFAKKDTILKYYPLEGKKLFDIIESEVSAKKKVSTLRDLSDQVKTTTKELELQYYIFCQINKLASSAGNLDLRDENMARFVQLIQQQHDDSLKAIIWAHNGHVNKYGNPISERKPLGQHLAAWYGDEYAAIGLDFKEGVFLAVDSEQLPKRNFDNFTLYPLKNTLANEIDFEDEPFVVMKSDTLKKTFYFNAIGAIYEKKPDKWQAFYAKVKPNKHYDYYIISKISSPITLLSKLYE